MVEILVVEFINAPHAVLRRDDAVENVESGIEFFLGLLLILACLLHHVALLVVRSGSFGAVVGVKVEDLEGLIEQCAWMNN